MKTYPQVADYAKAVVAPTNYTKLKTLKPSSISKVRGFATGEFAVVFKMKDVKSNKFYAMKCFTKEVATRKLMYDNISKYLKKAPNPYFVQYVYLDKEVRVQNAVYPIVFMQWIEGKTLTEHVADLCADNETTKLMDLANAFDTMAIWLLEQDIAHGDLKPENIIVTPENTLKLVDYDAMFLPVFRGKLATEIGTPDYRHPKRRKEQFNRHIDDFAILVLSLSLHALAIDPQLYKKIPDSDALLFTALDYKHLSQFKHINFFKKHVKTPVLYARFCLLTHTVLQPSIELSSLKDILVKNPARQIEEESPVPLSDDDYDFQFDEKNKVWQDKYGVRYSPEKTLLIKAPWRRQAIIIPKCVHTIGKLSFSKCEALTSLEIPATVTVIHDSAFAYCSALPNLTLPNSITNMGDKVFQNCRALQSIVLSQSLIEIGYDTFENCKSLEVIAIPNSVEEIKDGAFKNCSALKKIIIPESVERIGSSAFKDCVSLQTVIIENPDIRLGDAVFLNCKALSEDTIADLEERFGPSCIKGSLAFKI